MKADMSCRCVCVCVFTEAWDVAREPHHHEVCVQIQTMSGWEKWEGCEDQISRKSKLSHERSGAVGSLGVRWAPGPETRAKEDTWAPSQLLPCQTSPRSLLFFFSSIYSFYFPHTSPRIFTPGLFAFNLPLCPSTLSYCPPPRLISSPRTK